MQKIKIKLKKSEIEALGILSFNYWCVYDPVGYGNMVTKELIWEINCRIDTMMNNSEQKKFTLNMTGSQAMAFVAFWVHIDLTRHPYERVIINRIIEMIHKTNLYARLNEQY